MLEDLNENLEKQIEFDFDQTEDKKPSAAWQSFANEQIDCQYCQDVGPCMYCDRGKIEISEMKKGQKAA